MEDNKLNIDGKILNFVDIINDLEEIGRKLYLDSPETWIDFSSKVSDQSLDEMVLFYAAKYNYLSILKYTVDNKIINLDAPSKNTNYSSIREHLLAVSKNYKSDDVYNFLSGDFKSSDCDNNNYNGDDTNHKKESETVFEKVLEKCKYLYLDGREIPLSLEMKNNLILCLFSYVLTVKQTYLNQVIKFMKK